MSLKQYFDNKNSKFFNKSLKEVVGKDFESFDYLDEVAEERDRFIPNIDFSDPGNFAKYGSAEEYFKQSIARVKDLYPYDGSRQEKLDFHNKSTFLDIHVFDEVYPRTTGYGIFSPTGWGTNTGFFDTLYGISDSLEYIGVQGGPNSGPLNTRDGGNVYDTGSFRGSNLALDLSSSGWCAEFWLKKSGSLPAVITENEVLVDYWNNSTSVTDKGVVTFELYKYYDATVAPFRLRIVSGSTTDDILLGDVALKSTLYEGDWKHIAVSYNSQTASLFIDGFLYESSASTNAYGDIKGNINANIGGLLSGSIGAGKLSGSIDEFRHWKSARNGEEIERNFFKQVYGGTNVVDANVKLGVYYKFNEGISGRAATDATVLDYSGRISNGSWTGYNASSRSTGSAMVESSASLFEFKDPILYDFNPAYTAAVTSVENLTIEYDLNNPSSLYNSFPDYMTDQDFENGSEFRKLIQTISSYFDTLHAQIEYLNRIKNIEYVSGSSTRDLVPINFAKTLLEEKGFYIPELFVESTILEDFSNTDGDRKFENKLFNVKNLIYKNIYNNLTHIYKTKGTERSVRNLLRCFGVDESLIRVNVYPNNFVFDIDDRRRLFSRSKNYLDFSKKENNSAVVYNYASGSSLDGFVTGSTVLPNEVPMSMECEAYFPKIDFESDFFASTLAQSASVFGWTGVEGSLSAVDANYITTEPVTALNNSGRVYAVKTVATQEQITTKFVFTSDAGQLPTLESPQFEDVYDNAEWVLGVKFYTDLSISGSFNLNQTSTNLLVEFSGYNSIGDTIINEFAVTGSADGIDISKNNPLGDRKRFYAGAVRTNVTGTLLQKSDCKVGSLRVYYDYLSNDDLQRHSFDSQTYGTEGQWKENFALLSANLQGPEISPADTLVQHWNFDTVTTSDASGRFISSDISKPSSTSPAVQPQYQAMFKRYGIRGDLFETTSTAVVAKEFLSDYQLNPPEVLTSENLVSILESDDERFLRNQQFTEFNIMIEKSAQAGISDEMMQMFSTITDFSNLIGDYVNRYRMNYKQIDTLREEFYKKVNNVPKVEKFLNFYKWLDTAISTVAYQLMPGSSKLNLEHFTIIESHILERNKYYNKFPTLKFNPNIGFGRLADATGDIVVSAATSEPPVEESITPGRHIEINDADRIANLQPVDQTFPGSYRLNSPIYRFRNRIMRIV
jgi:hypothetical protein